MIQGLKRLTLLSGLAILAAAFIIGGCSQNSPLEPNQSQYDLALQSSARGSLPTLLSTTYDAGVVTKDDGGTIEISRDSYTHNFDVPSKSVSSDVIITVKTSLDKIGGRTALVFEFGPDGLKFDIPASLNCQLAEINAAATSGNLYYFDPDLRSWIYQGSNAVKDGIVSFDINHFSKYAISD